MQHLQFNRGTISLTERFLRDKLPALARYLRSAMLASESDTVNLILDEQHLMLIRHTLDALLLEADTGQKALILNLQKRWLIDMPLHSAC